jgi:hypothetical protein
MREDFAMESIMVLVQLHGRKYPFGLMLLDDEDADLAKFSWCLDSSGYPCRNGGKSGTERIHRTVLERKLGRAIANGFVTDHLNGLRADNRRSNLFEVSYSDNLHNVRFLRSDNKSGYRGVSKQKNGRWIGRIADAGNHYMKSGFKSAEDAAAWVGEMRRELGLYGL